MAQVTAHALATRAPLTAPSIARDWLHELASGLPAEFNDSVIRSVAAAKRLILALPNCNRGPAALALYQYRHLVGHDVACSDIMAGWDRDHHGIIAAFGSPAQFLAALRWRRQRCATFRADALTT